MNVIRKSALVPYSADAMYGLVADVERYGEFLPWCGGARILARASDALTASVGGWNSPDALDEALRARYAAVVASLPPASARRAAAVW